MPRSYGDALNPRRKQYVLDKNYLPLLDLDVFHFVDGDPILGEFFVKYVVLYQKMIGLLIQFQVP